VQQRFKWMSAREIFSFEVILKQFCFRILNSVFHTLALKIAPPFNCNKIYALLEYMYCHL
jgi:hypothetical protein